MARPLSDTKRNAILTAAARAIATSGLAASTKAIARDAGIGEGTFFVYFQTKEDLFRELFLELNADLSRAIAADYPRDGDTQARFRHMWDRLVGWGLRHPDKREALRQLSVSQVVAHVRKRADDESCAAIASMIEADMRCGRLRPQPVEFLSATIYTLGQTVADMIVRERARCEEYLDLGWEALWGAIAAR